MSKGSQWTLAPKRYTNDQQALEKMIISQQENANQNHNKIYHLTQKDKRDMKKLECIANGSMKWCSCFGKQSGHFLKKHKTVNTSIPLYTPKDVKNIGSQKDLYLECL